MKGKRMQLRMHGGKAVLLHVTMITNVSRVDASMVWYAPPTHHCNTPAEPNSTGRIDRQTQQQQGNPWHTGTVAELHG